MLPQRLLLLTQRNSGCQCTEESCAAGGGVLRRSGQSSVLFACYEKFPRSGPAFLLLVYVVRVAVAYDTGISPLCSAFCKTRTGASTTALRGAERCSDGGGVVAGLQIRNLVGNESVRFFVSPYMRARQTLLAILQAFDGRDVRVGPPAERAGVTHSG